jgi:hypothetical protein
LSTAKNAALVWFRSSHSGNEGGACLEVATGPDLATVHVRDSKNTAHATLTLTPAAWTAFLGHLTGGR